MSTTEGEANLTHRELSIGLAAILIAYGLVGLAIYLLPINFEAYLAKTAFTVIVTNLMALAVAPFIVAVACLLGRPGVSSARAISENLLAVILGLLAGWALAIFWVPYGTADTKVYGQIGGAVAVFVSGYAISKIDKVLDKKLFPAQEPDTQVLTKVLLAVASLTLTALTVVTNRVSWLEKDMEDKPEVYAARAELEAALANVNARAAIGLAERTANKKSEDPEVTATKLVAAAEQMQRIADDAARTARELVEHRKKELARVTREVAAREARN